MIFFVSLSFYADIVCLKCFLIYIYIQVLELLWTLSCCYLSYVIWLCVYPLCCYCFQSYAGKYVPAISYKIHMENQGSPKVMINFKGMAIGDGLCDPVTVSSLPCFCFSVRFQLCVDHNLKIEIKQQSHHPDLKGDANMIFLR